MKVEMTPNEAAFVASAMTTIKNLAAPDDWQVIGLCVDIVRAISKAQQVEEEEE